MDINVNKTGRETIASIVGTVMLVGFGGLMAGAGLGVIALGQITGMWQWLSATVVLLSATQVYGKDVLTAVSEFRSNSDSNSGPD